MKALLDLWNQILHVVGQGGSDITVEDGLMAKVMRGKCGPKS